MNFVSGKNMVSKAFIGDFGDIAYQRWDISMAMAKAMTVTMAMAVTMVVRMIVIMMTMVCDGFVTAGEGDGGGGGICTTV